MLNSLLVDDRSCACNRRGATIKSYVAEREQKCNVVRAARDRGIG